MNNEINVTKLHERLLVMAKFFHNFCVKNGIQYYMLGGTMLGAVRHKGFIPWDDDMDFGIPRKDYDRFIQLAQTSLSERYEVRYYGNTENSPMHYAKFIDTSTTLIENHYHNYVEGLYLDIFPLDGADIGTLFDEIRNKRIIFTHALIMNHCTTTVKTGVKRKLFNKYARLCNLNKLHATLEELMTEKSNCETEYLANFLGAWAEKETIPRTVMGTPTLYHFEDTQFYGAEGYDGYLQHLYGDYMKLPPADKRVFKHNFYYLDFNTPYKKYIADNKE